MISILNRNIAKKIGVLAVASACLYLLVTLQQSQLDAINRPQSASLEQLKAAEETERFRLNLLKKVPTFGFDNLFANWTFLSFLQYFGDDEVRRQTGYSLSPEYFEIILSNDPRFLDAYYFLSASSALYAGVPERGIEIMERSLASLSPKDPPYAYYIWRYKGIDELLFLGDGKAAQHSFEMAAQWAEAYSDPESQDVAEVSRRTAQFLAHNPNSKTAQVSVWSMVLGRTNDDRTRQIAVSRIQALGGQITITEDGAVRVFLPKQD